METLTESSMVEEGKKRFERQAKKAQANEQESRTKYGKALMTGLWKEYDNEGKPTGVVRASHMETLIAGLEEAMAPKQGAGRRQTAVAVLRQLDCPTIAFITLRSVVDSITTAKTLTRAARLVGVGIEIELRFRHFRDNNPQLWGTLTRDLERREPNLTRRQSILLHEMKKAQANQTLAGMERWDQAQHLHVGMKCLDTLLRSTTLCQVYRQEKFVGKKRYTVDFIQAAPAMDEFIKQMVAEDSGILAPMLMPMASAPKPWRNPFVGGYEEIRYNDFERITLVKVHGERGKNYTEELANKVADMPMVYQSINAVQATQWKVNESVLEVMEQCWKMGLAVSDLPSTQDAPLPPKPLDIDTNEEARKEWSRKASEVYSLNAKRRSKAIQMDRLLWIARQSVGSAVYFPMQLDFRGRMYALPTFLNPQGNDPAKALLTFANGKKLGANGLRWLLIHAANCYGEDKISLDAREQWALDHLDMMIMCAYRPFEHRQWMEADKGEKAWQFLAVCIEIYEAYKLVEPTEYVSSLPVSVDGTCNGLQHFSAMLLDDEGAAAVNLKPAAVPQDIYQRVADRVKVRLEVDAAQGDVMAMQWLAWGFDRKATKRAVMVVPYSGSFQSAKAYTLDYVQKKKDCPWKGKEKLAANLYFAKHVWASIGEIIVSAKAAMKWLRGVSRRVTQAGVPMIWTTPVGFPVRQDYRETESHLVKILLGPSIRYRPTLSVETEKLDENKQSTGISPNFVHSLDAACLMLTVVRAKQEGVDSFAMVHDSYGALAADMDTLYVCLRQAFVDIYQNDVMGDFLKEATSSLTDEQKKKLPTMPAKGSFVLESVKDSKYFFA